MNVRSVITAFQRRNSTLAGVRSAPDKMPASLADGDLAAALTWFGPGEWDRIMFGTAEHKGVYVVRFYVASITHMTEADIQDRVIALAETVGESYVNKPDLTDATGAVIATVQLPFHHGGITGINMPPLPFASVLYHGVEFRFPAFELGLLSVLA